MLPARRHNLIVDQFKEHLDKGFENFPYGTNAEEELRESIHTRTMAYLDSMKLPESKEKP